MTKLSGESQLNAKLISTVQETFPPVILVAIAVVVVSVTIVSFYSWAMALILTLTLSLWAGLTSNSATVHKRLTIFFSLFALINLPKRMVFLLPDQSPWSQYLVLVLPTLYYAALILVPTLPRIIAPPLLRIEKLVIAYLVLASAMTWLGLGATLLGRLAASGLILLPWTIILIGMRWGWEALPSVSRTLVFWGVINVLYGLWQFIFGPTLVELRWAESAEFSIGARHLITAMSSEGPQGVWRVIGIQSDGFSLGLFLLISIIGLEVLAARRQIRKVLYVILFGLLLLGIGLSMVRTIWIAFIVFIVTRLAIEYSTLLRHTLLRYARLIFPLSLVGTFLLAIWIASTLYQFTHLVRMIPNPLLARILTPGTLEARKDALTIFLDILPERLITGLGYGVDPYIAGKFGSTVDLPPNFEGHNVFVEQLWYVGLPGLMLFVLVLCEAFIRLAQRYFRGNQCERRVLAVLIAGLLALLTTGFSNGGSFLDYPFFFLLGVAASREQHNIRVVNDESNPTSRACCRT